MIWWWVLTPIVIIVGMYLWWGRAMTRIAGTETTKEPHHSHYLQGQPFTLPDGTWAYCVPCKTAFRIRGGRVHHQAVPNHYIEVELP